MKMYDVEITGSFKVSSSNNDVINISASYAVTASYVSGSGASVSASYAATSSYASSGEIDFLIVQMFN